MPTTCKLIAKHSLSNSTTASVTFSDIPATFTDLLIVASCRSVNTAAGAYMPFGYKFNGSTTDYTSRSLEGTGSGAFSGTNTTFTAFSTTWGRLTTAGMPKDTATANTFGNMEWYIPNYAGATNKSWSVTGVAETNAAAANMEATAGLWSNTAAITSIEIVAGTDYYKSGSTIFLYGITKS